MQVFISWSGKKASSVGEAVKVFLENTFPGHVKTFFSPEDVAPGDRFEAAITSNLTEASLGVLLVTRANQGSAWLLFEAGALALKANRGSVMPVLLDMPRGDLLPPLNQFQNVEGANRAGFLKICGRIREVVSVPDTSFNILFEKTWPPLEEALKVAASIDEAEAEPSRSVPDMVQEILLTVNSLARRGAVSSSRDDARRERERRRHFLMRARSLTSTSDGISAGGRTIDGFRYSWNVEEFPRDPSLTQLADVARESGFDFRLERADGSALLVTPSALVLTEPEVSDEVDEEEPSDDGGGDAD